MQKMIKRLLLTITILFLGFGLALSQNPEKATLTGVIHDQDDEPLAYASVAAFEPSGSEVIDGTTADSTGRFALNLDPGSYIVEISFLSYQTHEKEIDLETGEILELGVIVLNPRSEQLGEVVVEGEKSRMQMSFDRRVFQVGEDITSLGGTALDVLDKVPSLSIDIEGNISLRGNESVRVLINGKPSNLVRGDVESLQSLPSSRIKEVEIITNPSAKYSAEGTAGIINIILKKKRDPGFNGTVGAGAGIPQDYELSTDLNYRFDGVNLFFGGGFEFGSRPESGRSFQRFSSPDTSYMYREVTDATENELEGNMRFGADFFMPSNQTLTATASIDLEQEENLEDVTYTDMQLSGDIIQRVARDADETQDEKDFEFQLEYVNRIQGDDHKLTADADIDLRIEEENSDLREQIVEGATDPLFQRTRNDDESFDMRFNAEYVRPILNNGEFEAGVRSNFEWMDNTQLVEERQNGIWQPLNAFNDNFLYYENVNAAFATAGSEFGSFSAEIGLRLEHTRIRTELKRTGDVGRQNYVDLFPSVFLNYKFNEQQSVQISYSRRLDRPWSRMLLPFSDFSDSRSRFTGNPDLEPEFANSYEAGYLHYWGSGSLLTSFYYRHREGVIERITTLDNQGITRIFPINLATENAWGVELSADQEIFSGMTLTANANLFHSESEGSYQGQLLTSKSEMLQGRLGLRWRVTDVWRFEADMRYRGPRETTQGRREAMTMLDTGISRELFDGKATLAFNVNDVLDSRNFQSTVNNPNFFSEREFSWSTRSFSLNFTYHLNRQDDDRRDRRGGPPQDSGDFE
ncbi:MAG: outer membrane beta-barrel family protein [Balneolaceae bacterium]|nr:outer membrane beta-barrel family protein [Balneolaceae bacterium]